MIEMDGIAQFVGTLQSNSTVEVSPLRRDLSGIAGSTSLACWIVLLLPQLIEQWRLQSAEGIAIGFIVIWFLGDLANLSGAILGHLLSEVILLAVWFCLSDFLIICSYFYYTHVLPRRKERRLTNGALNENRPLLDGEVIPGADNENLNRRASRSSKRQRRSSLDEVLSSPHPAESIFLNYVLPVLFVVLAGCVGFFISARQNDDSGDQKPEPDQGIEWLPQVLGYISAVLYLGARIPQIIQNHKRKSVYGLSLLFFIFSTFGNLTYAAQIVFYRSDSAYILLNLPWLLGSVGTIFEDSIIFIQFFMYRSNSVSDSVIMD